MGAVKIWSMNKLRWDIRIGLFASALAIAGFISSIMVHNDKAFWSSGVTEAQQITLLIFAVAILGMTLAKWWQSKQQD